MTVQDQPTQPARQRGAYSHQHFRFAMHSRLALLCSGEVGEVIARTQHAHRLPEYLLRYATASGRAVEAWWCQSALEDTGQPMPAWGDRVDAAAAQQARPEPINAGAWGIAPPIGQLWDEHGGDYMGIARGLGGAPDVHVILCPETPGRAYGQWGHALAWAANLAFGGHRDWLLPLPHEGALVFAQAGDRFPRNYHWLGSAHSNGDAWRIDFANGEITLADKCCQLGALAVRRIPIHYPAQVG